MANEPFEEWLNGIAAAGSLAVYAFVFWLTTIVWGAAYLGWAVIPAQWLASTVGAAILPSQHWALALPAHFFVCLVFLFALYVGIGLMKTPALGSLRLVRDQHTRDRPQTEEGGGGGGGGGGSGEGEGQSQGLYVDPLAPDFHPTPNIYDLSAAHVCAHIFLRSRGDSDGDDGDDGDGDCRGGGRGLGDSEAAAVNTTDILDTIDGTTACVDGPTSTVDPSMALRRSTRRRRPKPGI
jgi:hypothetical protein